MWGASPEAFGSHAAQVRRFSGANSARLLLGHRERSASINDKRSRTLEARPARPSLSSPQRLVAATESIWSGRARARKRAKYYAAATAAAEEKHVEAKDEEDDRAGGTISSLLAAVLGR